MVKKLFPANLPELQWSQFAAEGFSQPVSGVIHRADQPPCCDVPLGGISTGCIDIDARGIFGFSSLFNPKASHPTHEQWRMPRKLPTLQPFLGLATGGKVWVLAAEEMIHGGEIPWCTEPQMLEVQGKKAEPHTVTCPTIKDVRAATDIHYWGHYPVVDMEFETNAPVSVGLRAWAPFLPGDTAASNIPAAVFEVHLRNISQQSRQGTIAFDFPGPDMQEAGAAEFARRLIVEDFSGVHVSSSSRVN